MALQSRDPSTTAPAPAATGKPDGPKSLADIRRIVLTVRDLLDRDPEVTADELGRMAGQHDAVCKEVVRRLSKSCASAAAGHVAPAIELAEAAPALPDVLHALDAAPLKAWNALLSKHKLPLAATFNERQIKQIEEAYLNPAAVAPLRKAYEALRAQTDPTPNPSPLTGRGAGQAAPHTREQLAVLRRLRLADRGNAEWCVTLSMLEAQRQTELRTLLAAPNITVQGAEAIIEELSEPGWLVLPPREQIENAKKLRTATRQRAMQAALVNVAAHLKAAIEALDHKTAGELLKKVERIEKHVEIPEAFVEQITNAREWLQAHETEFLHQMNELESMLEDLRPSRQVRWLLRDIEAAGQQLPSILHQRTISYIAQHEIGEQRQRRLFRVVLAVVAVAVAGTLAYISLKG